MFIIRPGPEGAGYNDLYESGDKDSNPNIQKVIDHIKREFAKVQADTAHSKVDWTKVSLKFMRLEKVSLLFPITPERVSTLAVEYKY